MSEQRKVKTRIQNKYDTLENWSKATEFVPLKGELIAQTDSLFDFKRLASDNVEATNGILMTRPSPILKMGDGHTPLNKLPFLNLTNVTFDSSNGITNYSFSVIPDNSSTSYFFVPDGNTLNIDYLLSLPEFHPFASMAQNFAVSNSIYTFIERGEQNYITINLKLKCSDESDTASGAISSDGVLPYMNFHKSLVRGWSVTNTVTNSSFEKPVCNLENRSGVNGDTGETDTWSEYQISYKIYLPDDKDDSGLYIFNAGLVKIDLKSLLLCGGTEGCVVEIDNDIKFNCGGW